MRDVLLSVRYVKYTSMGNNTEKQEERRMQLKEKRTLAKAILSCYANETPFIEPQCLSCPVLFECREEGMRNSFKKETKSRQKKQIMERMIESEKKAIQKVLEDKKEMEQFIEELQQKDTAKLMYRYYGELLREPAEDKNGDGKT